MSRHLLLFASIIILLASALTYAHMPGRQSELTAATKEADSFRDQRLVLMKPYIEMALRRSGESPDVRNLSDAFKAAAAGLHESGREAALDAALAKLVSNPEIYPLLLTDKGFLALHNRLDQNESMLSEALVRVSLAASARRIHNRGLMHRIAGLFAATVQNPPPASGARERVAIAPRRGKNLTGLYSVAMQ